jgi:hypothetical protein
MVIVPFPYYREVGELPKLKQLVNSGTKIQTWAITVRVCTLTTVPYSLHPAWSGRLLPLAWFLAMSVGTATLSGFSSLDVHQSLGGTNQVVLRTLSNSHSCPVVASGVTKSSFNSTSIPPAQRFRRSQTARADAGFPWELLIEPSLLIRP